MYNSQPACNQLSGSSCTAGLQSGTRAASGQAASTSEVSEELPYTIAAPESYEEFAALVAGRSAADLSAAIQRIMACNSLALASDNRRKLQVRLPERPQSFACRLLMWKIDGSPACFSDSSQLSFCMKA